VDWVRVEADLDAYGAAVIEKLLAPEACRELVDLYARDERFRSRVVMARHGFGRGEYKYLAYPLPRIVADLRKAMYPPLAGIANRWNEALRLDLRYPTTHAGYLERCHAAGQCKPTPLLLSYGEGDYNCLHRTCTANMSSRCSSRYCCRNRQRTSTAANSCWSNSVRACSRVSK
jgi:hypothetical protein